MFKTKSSLHFSPGLILQRGATLICSAKTPLRRTQSLLIVMLHRNTTTNTPSFGSLLAFKPRQVLLAQHNNLPTTTTSMDQTELKGNLHELILDYLRRNGFSKTLKRFQSEAQIQTDAWKASSLHLEDMFCKHNACNADANKNTSEKPVLGNDEVTTKKKKKKVIVENDDCAIKDQSEVTGKKIKESSKNVGQISKDITVDEPETQPKKKKTKHDLVSSTDDAVNGSKTNDLTKKNKDRMKKDIEKVNLEPSTTNEDELVTAQKEKKKKKKSRTDENLIVQPDETKKEKKSSKKRKRSSSDENKNENVSTEITISEELKRQKTETSKEKNSRKEEINALEISNEQFDGETNGKLEKDGVKSKKKQRNVTAEFDGETNGKLEKDGVKSKKKQRNVTAEPKTVNAFQRVKIDEVEFAHDKLQDNSYWAKGGAEIGYGAKAQEVLGQVRGRDFRHEKTKKKRGSYRGGLIDQQSHSIKFNYSDGE
ncbi:putative transcription factor interactor and regulator LisH family [Helianthus anomalus]